MCIRDRINGPGNWDTRRKRAGVSWWGEQHHQRGRAYASTRSRSPRYTRQCVLRSITQNGACSDLPLGLMRLPTELSYISTGTFPGTHSPDIQTIQSDYTTATSRYYSHITNTLPRAVVSTRPHVLFREVLLLGILKIEKSNSLIFQF